MHFLLRQCSILIMIASLMACGFNLRGSGQFNYKSIYMLGNTQINRPLATALKTNGVQVIEDAANAELQLELLNEESEKRILSLSGRGLVREFELFYRVHFRTKAASESVWSPPQTIEARRDFSYEDANLLAKLAEERLLYENMREDVVNGLIRRLALMQK